MEEEKEFEVWIEGFAITGNESEASFCGRFKGKNFRDAVLKSGLPVDDRSEEKPIPALVSQREREMIEASNRLCSWGCRYFDNETDARKSFG